jgi:uncharacterized protein YbaP (TraB family)
MLGAFSPLSTKMTWRSKEVETVIAESQRVIRWVSVDTDIDINIFSALAAIPSAMKIANNPGDAKLKDVLPAEVYAQWQPLKAKYFGKDNDVEKHRPAFAAGELRARAIVAAGLSSEFSIWPSLERLAKQHKVKILKPEVTMHIKVDKPRQMIKSFRKSQVADIECFSHSITNLENDIEAMKLRANAWAVGDVEALRILPPADPKSDCSQILKQALYGGQLAEDIGTAEMLTRASAEAERVQKEQNEVWMRTVEDALHDQSALFAIVPIEALIDDGILLKGLTDRGYVIDAP